MIENIEKPLDDIEEERIHARGNNVVLLGTLRSNPELFYSNDDEILSCVKFYLCTIRGTRDVSRGNSKEARKAEKHDSPMIIIEEPELMQKAKNWRVNDIVQVSGAFTTRKTIKIAWCKECGTKYEKKNAVLAYVYITDGFKVKSFGGDEPSDEPLEYLREHREVSNRFWGFGTVVNNPKMRKLASGFNVLDVPMGINRKLYVKTDDPNNAADYPHLKCYGSMVDNNVYKLKKDSLIYVEGFIQVRVAANNKGSYKCKKCGKSVDFRDLVTEIVPYKNGIEYIANFRTDKEVKELQKEKDDELLRKAGLGKWVGVSAGQKSELVEEEIEDENEKWKMDETFE